MADRRINISNDKSRHAEVYFFPYTKPKHVFHVDDQGNPIQTKKYIKSTAENNMEHLQSQYEDLNAIAEALIMGDPELDMENTGKYLSKTSRVYVNTHNEVVYKISKTEKVFSPTGELKEEREPKHMESNITDEIPIKWSGKLMKKSKIYNKFVFVRKYQLKHHDGLTYDFLYDMAKMLSEKKSMMLIGTGKKGVGPLVFQDGGNSFQTFLEGRIKGDKYCLIMHITNLKLTPLKK